MIFSALSTVASEPVMKKSRLIKRWSFEPQYMKICDSNPGGCPILCFALFCLFFFAFSHASTSPFITQSKLFYSLSLERMTKRDFKINSAESAWGRNYPTSPNYWDFEARGRFGGFFLSLSLLGDLIPTFWKCSNVHNLDDSPSISLLWDVSQFWGSAASGTQWNFFDEDFNITIF